MPPPLKSRFSHDQIILTYALLAGTPAVIAATGYLWIGDRETDARWVLTLLIWACWLGFALAAQTRVVRSLQTMTNLLSALREGDFATRARGARRGEALGGAMAEINTLSHTLQEQRLSALEATALLRTVMDEINIAIFAFDAEQKLRLANPAAQLLLGRSAEQILGRDAAELGLSDCLKGAASRLLTSGFSVVAGRWSMRRSEFREGGRPHQLVVIADLSRTLREEEALAWQRLVRVLGHELNNSLAPIKSIAGSLGVLVRNQHRAADWEDDMRRGLEVIATRADSLARFMEAYARLARLPPPTPAPCDLAALAQRVAALEMRLPVELHPGPPLTLACDIAQIEQLLINVIKNAVDAVLEQHASKETSPAAASGAAGGPVAGSGVRLSWAQRGTFAEVVIEDDGPGIANATNLFVPFFTTKPEGSGIGLVLCRQIAENHGGSLTLAQRTAAQGCIATLRLPV